MSRFETSPSIDGVAPAYNDFGRVTNFYYDEFNNLVPHPNPFFPRAFWMEGETIGPPHDFFKQIR